jgi:hypothetical protein
LYVASFGQSHSAKLEYESYVRDRNPRRERRGHAEAKKPSSPNITPSLVTLQRLKGSSLQYIVGSAHCVP